jgi:GT2 family glycosyltransferase
MEKLPISIGILSWHSGQVLVDTLTTYYNNGLFDMVNDVTILFQEVNQQDVQIAAHFGLDFIGLQKNIGIGQGFIKLTENAKSDYVLVLEHD